MKNDIDDLLGSVFGKSRAIGAHNLAGGTPSPLTLEPQKSEKPSKADAFKSGAAAAADALMTTLAGAGKAADAAVKAVARPSADEAAAESANTIDGIQKAVLDTNDALNARIASQQQQIAEMNANAKADIERISRELETPAVKNLATNDTAAEIAPGSAGAGAEGFDGIFDALQKNIFGQDEYLKKLIIALKRPYVMGHTGECARNSILISGGECTGKRLGLIECASALKSAGVFASDGIAWVDLSLYPTPSEEKLFLQDVYMALSSDAEIVAFTNYEKCSAGFLTVLANLIQKGESPLTSRYVMQSGRLIDAGTALVSDAVSEITPRGKYLVIMTEKPVNKLADSFGAPFVSSLGDICETTKLSADALLCISNAQYESICKKAADTLKYTLSCTDDAKKLACVYEAGAGGAQGVLDFWQTAFKSLAQKRLESGDNKPQSVDLTAKDGSLCAKFDGEEAPLFDALPKAYTGSLEEVKAEMDKVIGLDEIKKYIFSLEDNFAVQRRRKEQGLKTASVSMHMIFTGNPGTGKTTIARLVSRYLKAIGVLSGGQLVEVTRADLVGKYVGHTAPLTMQVLKSAIGGVLFIDEAYSLYRGQDDSFGLECIDTLVKGMEDNRDNLIVILAGYTKEMQTFLTSNSGLKSRFPNIIEFPDYTGQQLLEILKLQAAGKGYTVDAGAEAALTTYFNTVQMAHARDAGNGRLARNKVEEAILNQSKRVAKDEKADLSLLLAQDFVLDDVKSITTEK
jgi:AAA+ superfamily predicted ATPase